MQGNVNANNFNLQILKEIIINELSEDCEDQIIENCINKIPEIFALIAKEKLISLYRNNYK